MGGFQKQYQVTARSRAAPRLRGHRSTRWRGRCARSNSEVGGRRASRCPAASTSCAGAATCSDLGGLGDDRRAGQRPGGAPVRVQRRGHACASARTDPPRRGRLRRRWARRSARIVIMRYGENALGLIERVEAQARRAAEDASPRAWRSSPPTTASGLIDRSIDTLRHALARGDDRRGAGHPPLPPPLPQRAPAHPQPAARRARSPSCPMYLLGIPSTIMSLGGHRHRHRRHGRRRDRHGRGLPQEAGARAAGPVARRSAPGSSAEAAREVTPAIFFSLLIIAVSFIPVFGLNGEAGRLFRPLAFTQDLRHARGGAPQHHPGAGAARSPAPGAGSGPRPSTPSRASSSRSTSPSSSWRCAGPSPPSSSACSRWLSAVPLALPAGQRVHAAAQRGRPALHADHPPQPLHRRGERGSSSGRTRSSAPSPRCARVFGKVGRAETPTDPAPLSMVETIVRLHPPEQLAQGRTSARWYSSWAPAWLKRRARACSGPSDAASTWDELTAKMNARPAPARLDQRLDHAHPDPHRHARHRRAHAGGHQDLRRRPRTPSSAPARSSRRCSAASRGRAASSTSASLGGIYLDIVPDRDALAALRAPGRRSAGGHRERQSAARP